MSSKRILFFKQALLFIAACAVLLIYFNVGVYNRFYDSKMAGFKDEVSAQLEHMSLPDRYVARFGSDAYLFTQYIKYYVDSPRIDNTLILLPPVEYLKAYNFNAIAPEPIIYYYFIGYKCITPQSRNVYDANYAVYLKDGYPAIIRVNGKQDINEILELYKTRPR